MYKVIKFFTDLQDNKHPYNVGDTFPREGVEVTEDRIRELATTENRRNEPLIEEIVEDAAEETETAEETAEEVETAEETTEEVETAEVVEEKPKKKKGKKDATDAN